jgi:hypothetical protein
VGLPPLLWSFPPTTAFTSFPAPGYWACAITPAFSSPVSLFTAHVGNGSYPLSCGVFLPLPLLQASCSWLLGVCHRSCLLWPGLFIYSSVRGSPSSLFGAQGSPPSLLCVFFVVIAYYSVSLFFPGWRGRSVQIYADLVQGCLCEYCVPLNSPCGPRLPKPSGRWHLASGFFL